MSTQVFLCLTSLRFMNLLFKFHVEEHEVDEQEDEHEV